MTSCNPKRGVLATRFGNANAQLTVLKSAAGYYIGTLCESGLPFTRESSRYWSSRQEAEAALKTGHWPQKHVP